MAEQNSYARNVLRIIDELQKMKPEVSLLEVINEGGNRDYK